MKNKFLTTFTNIRSPLRRFIELPKHIFGRNEIAGATVTNRASTENSRICRRIVTEIRPLDPVELFVDVSEN